MKNDELLKEFEESFNSMKKEMGFKSKLEELEEVFFLKDFILQAGFVSPKLSRMICGRIRDTFGLWIQKMHSWLMPNPSSMPGMTESKSFSDKDKEDINNLMNEFSAFISENIVIGLEKDKKKEAEYIDRAMGLWNKRKDKLLHYTKKANEHWNEQLNG